MTTSTYDLYWIAAHPEYHGKGVGRALIQHCEATIHSFGGKLIIVETSSLPKYRNTRKFYLRNEYIEVARVKDYYSPGDDLMVYTKHLS